MGTSKLISADETWILYDVTLNRRISPEWLRGGSAGRDCPRLSKTNDKLSLTCCCDHYGLIYCKYHKSNKQHPRLDEYLDCGIFERMIAHLTNENAQKAARKILVLSHHTSTQTIAKLQQLNIESLPRPSFLPDFEPSDYYLSGALRSRFRKSPKFNQAQFESDVKTFFDDKSNE